MKQNEKFNLSEKFWMGETSLSEETSFFSQNLRECESPADELYVKFVTLKRDQNTELEEQVWKQITQKTRFRKRTLYAISIAASFLLIVASVAVLELRKTYDHEASFALLEQTLKHVSEGIDPDSKPGVDIIYEDETIVIVSENSN